MVSLSVVLVMAATSMTVGQWMVVWLVDVLWMYSVQFWALMVLQLFLVLVPLVSLHVMMLTVFDMSSVDLLTLLNCQVLLERSLELMPDLHLTLHR